LLVVVVDHILVIQTLALEGMVVELRVKLDIIILLEIIMKMHTVDHKLVVVVQDVIIQIVLQMENLDMVAVD
jgi:hypothetical protein